MKKTRCLLSIVKFLRALQEEKLTCVLKEYKTTIGWTIADIKGISPSMFMHRILLEDGAKPTSEAQHWLTPNDWNCEEKILKLLDVGISYPI